MARLTNRRLQAICEALGSRLAGEINAEFGDEFPLKRKDYEAALEWANEQQNDRKKQRAARLAE